MPSEWHDWHDFYMLLGTASAALVALLFVAVSIGASFLSPERSTATRTFMSPVVFHFSTLLIISLIAMVPSHTALSLVIGIAAVAIAGLGYTTVVLVGLARASISDIADRFGYGILPLVSYVTMLAAAGLVISRATLAADILAAALLLLLTLKQNSPVSRTFSSVCFSVPSGLRAIVSEIIGGMTQTTVKKENGARLLTPLLLTVDAQPIGRGTTAPVSSR